MTEKEPGLLAAAEKPASSSPTETAITPPTIEIIEPLDMDKAQQAFERFQQFKERLLTKEDFVTIGKKRYLKKSAWRKWALICGISDRILSVERVPSTGKDAEGGFHYRIVAEAYHSPTGRAATGTAIASSHEKENWAHTEHDVYALCHTRAKNRAIADLVGGGEVSAEEIRGEEKEKDTIPTVEDSNPRSEQAPPVTSEASLDPAELDRLPWQSMGKNPAGKWVFGDVHGAELIIQRLRERGEDIILGDWKYHLSIPKDGDQIFLNRFLHAEKDATK